MPHADGVTRRGRRRRQIALPLAVAVVALLAATVAAAAPGAFTSRASFEAALPGGAAALDFEGLAAGTDVSGSLQSVPGAVVSIVLPGPVGDVLDPSGPALPLRVVAGPANPAASGSNSLGTLDPGNFDAFVAGTALDLAFTAPVDAFGLVVITPEEPGQALFDGDLQLVVAGEATAILSLADGQSLGSFDGRDYSAYFLGVVGAAPFQAARLESGPSMPPTSGFFFNVDDLVIPVPEPGRDLAVTVGVLALAVLYGLRMREVRPCDDAR